MSTPTEKRLLEAIAAAPDDDAPRLVYADWLTSENDPRGELIVIQIELAKVGVETVDAFVHWPETDRAKLLRVANLLRRQTQILEARRRGGNEPYRFTSYRRGFPTNLTAYPDTKIKTLTTFAEGPHPPLDELALWNVPDLAAVPQTLLREVRSLHLRGAVPPHFLASVLKQGRITNLKVEDGGDLDITPIIEAHGHRLTSLSLGSVSFSQSAFERLMRAKCMQSMREIAFQRVDAFREGANIAALFAPHVAPRLLHLKMENLELGGPQAFDSLTREESTTPWRSPKHIELLDVGGFDPLAMMTLLTYADVTALESLSVTFCAAATNATLEGLAACTHLRRLHSLTFRPLDDEAFSAKSFAALAKSASATLTKLALYLSEPPKEESFDALLTRHTLRTLDFETASRLNPSVPVMTTAPFAALATNDHATRLRSLALAGFEVRGAGIAPIATSPHLQALRRLALGNCPVDPAAAHLLASSPSMTDLTDLNLHSMIFTEGGAAINTWSRENLPFLQDSGLHPGLDERLAGR